ncbi:response regulator [Desulfovibrio ferrophilus]|uniref:Putative domain HDIG-containing protein n=1 Tax=Desulfovibrio ferrophilus TaxID=241368 RepID=A0A2Z6AZQ4_9BACT|nr:response regulator [Desulfovibrio ferrophilus]BBD08673.1 putative domain HDIG-containing protein [Desulfovibrio ferrophilus]
MKRRILFVDDEPKVLTGIRRMLFDMREEWELLFAAGGYQALEIIADKPVDVIVSDIRMPEMDGVELLGRVRKQYPEVTRIAMSGHSSAKVSALAALTVHQYLTKPCSVEDLKSVVNQALGRENILEDPALKRMVSRVDRLPSVPAIFQELTAELGKPEPSLPILGEIVARDVSMCAKILQLVNSSFFGFARHIESPQQAVTLLGVNVIKSLVLSVHLFAEFDAGKVPGFTLAYLWDHSRRVAALSRMVAEARGCSREDCDYAFIAGMLHDVGKLVLAENFVEEYNGCLEKVRSDGGIMWQSERNCLGVSHAEVGGYLMGLWGLPGPVADAIAYHHLPLACPESSAVLLAVHVANVMDHTVYVFSERSVIPVMDQQFLEQMGALDHVESWLETAREMIQESKDGDG